MKYKNFNKQNIKNVREEFQNALNEVGKKFGCNIKMGTIRYEDVEFSCKMNVTVDSPEAAAKSVERIPSFVQLGKIVTLNGVDYIVTGYKARSNKFPVCVKRVRDNKGFKITRQMAGF